MEKGNEGPSFTMHPNCSTNCNAAPILKASISITQTNQSSSSRDRPPNRAPIQLRSRIIAYGPVVTPGVTCALLDLLSGRPGLQAIQNKPEAAQLVHQQSNKRETRLQQRRGASSLTCRTQSKRASAASLLQTKREFLQCGCNPAGADARLGRGRHPPTLTSHPRGSVDCARSLPRSVAHNRS
jgi:hypothetical protein